MPLTSWTRLHRKEERMSKQKWSYSAGSKPYTVVVYERKPGGILQARAWNPNKRSWIRKSLGHKDRKAAEIYAKEQHTKLMKGDAELQQGRVTLAQVFALYRQHRTPRKTEREQRSDDRRIEMWTRVLGAGKDPHETTPHEWERFIEQRRAGVIDSRGNVRPEPKRVPVGDRILEKDCNWLRWVFGWAAKWRTAQGRYLMRENPARGYETPTERNPKRPVATQDRYEVIRALTDEIMMETRWTGKKARQRSYLSELLEIINGTGRRLSAVCSLTYEDLKLSEGPFGSVRWPADTDKMGHESTVPISPPVRAALDRILAERPGIGAAPLFPSPGDPTKPMTRHLADKWLRKAEKLAGLDPLKGSLWHAYRRKWVIERKHMPDVDVAAAGGWKSTHTLKLAYQQADPATILRVVLEASELREAR